MFMNIYTLNEHCPYGCNSFHVLPIPEVSCVCSDTEWHRRWLGLRWTQITQTCLSSLKYKIFLNLPMELHLVSPGKLCVLQGPADDMNLVNFNYAGLNFIAYSCVLNQNNITFHMNCIDAVLSLSLYIWNQFCLFLTPYHDAFLHNFVFLFFY